MKSLSVRFFPVFVALVLFGQGQARADLVDYSYHWSVAPSAVIPSGTGGVQIVLSSDGTTSSAVGAANSIPAATVSTFSAATNPPDNFNVSYDLKLHLTDKASGMAGDFDFAGSLSGQLTQSTSSLTSTFGNPTQMITLGSHTYGVTIAPASLTLPAPGATPLAELKAIVKVEDAPEPSTLALGAMAASVLGFVARRRRAALARA
jgi:hypothetical protein